MSLSSKVAAGVLTLGLLGAGAGAAVANEVPGVGGGGFVITKELVERAKSEFQEAKVDARTSEKAARTAAHAEQKTAQELVKDAKGKEKKAALNELKELKKENREELKELKAENREDVNEQKDEWHILKDRYHVQQQEANENGE